MKQVPDLNILELPCNTFQEGKQPLSHRQLTGPWSMTEESVTFH